MKIAIIHDYLTKIGGAENVLLVLHKMYPDAPIYTLLYDEVGTNHTFSDANIIPSKLNNLPKFIKNRSKILLPYFPQAIEEFDLSKYDIVISSSNSFAHGVITEPETIHITYCYSPTRYLWDWHNEYLEENHIGFGILGIFIRDMLHKIRTWDFLAADRTDRWIAISKTVAKRINKFYRKPAEIIFPPVEIENLLDNKEEAGDYYLIVSRLTPYKKIDLAIEAANKLNIKLKIAGTGNDLKRLKKIAGENVEFFGWVSDKKCQELYKKCRAFIFPGEDDFGITPVEAMAAGRPVVAYNRGGVTETVTVKTGVFFDHPTADSCAEAIEKLESNYSKFTKENCQTQAKKFSRQIFEDKFSALIDEYEKK